MATKPRAAERRRWKMKSRTAMVIPALPERFPRLGWRVERGEASGGLHSSWGGRNRRRCVGDGGAYGSAMGEEKGEEAGKKQWGPRSGVLLVQGRAGQGPGAAWRAGAVRPEQLELLWSLQRKEKQLLQIGPWPNFFHHEQVLLELQRDPSPVLKPAATSRILLRH